MGKEIERKFLVTDESYKAMAVEKHRIVQGYISRRKEGTVRVRIYDTSGFLTVKGANDGIVRNEWEYQVPVNDAEKMLENVCEGHPLEKVRWIVDYQGFRWEIDEFGGRLAPLVVAEVELDEDGVIPPLPPFVGREVSGDPQYYNSNLRP